MKSDDSTSTWLLLAVVLVSFDASIGSRGTSLAPVLVVVVSVDDTGDADGKLDGLLMIDGLEPREAGERTRAKGFFSIILRPESSKA